MKLFFWLALHRRLWTAERRKHHGLQDEDTCVLCDKELWFRLLQPVGLTALVPEQEENLGEWWLSQRRRLDRSARPAFDSLILLIAWMLWKERNDRTFQRTFRSVQEIVVMVVREAKDWVRAGFKSLDAACPIWLENSFTM